MLIPLAYLVVSFGVVRGDLLVGWVCLLALLQCLPLARGPARHSSYVLLGLSIILLVWAGVHTTAWTAGFSRNANILAVFLTVPLLGTPLRYGGYLEALAEFYARFVYNHNRLYLLTTTLSLFVGVLLNFAVIPIMYQLSKATGLRDATRTIGTAILRGYGAAVFWAPGFISVGMMLHALDLNLFDILAMGLALSAISLILGWIMEVGRIGGFRFCAPSRVKGDHKGVSWGKLGELVLIGTTLFGLVVLLDILTSIPLVNFIPLISLLFPIPWAALLGKTGHLLVEYKKYVNQVLPGQSNDVVLFVSAGFFGYAIQTSGFGNRVPGLVQGLGQMLPGGMVSSILFSIIILAVVGVHPVIPISTYLLNLSPAALGMPPQVMALALIAGWGLGASISPFSGVNLMMAGQSGISSAEIGLRWNSAYVAFMAVVVVTLLSRWALLLPV